MLRRGLNGLRLTGLSRKLFGRTDVPWSSFTERNKPDFDVGVDLYTIEKVLAYH